MFRFDENKPVWARNIRATDPLVPQRLVDEYVAHTRADLPLAERDALAVRAWPILAPMPFPPYGPGWWDAVTAALEVSVTKAGG